VNTLASTLRRPASAARAAWCRRSEVLPREPLYAHERVVDVLLRIGLAAVVAVTFASIALLAIVHVEDRFEVNQVAGTWFAMAQDLRAGVLYRPFFEDGYYGLSGYMPLQFIVNAGASFATDEYLVSAKLVAYLTGLALIAILFVMLRQSRCPTLLSLGLISALLATQTGLVAALGIHGDTLPLLFQLAALALLIHSQTRRVVAAAALLCALAFAAKFTAIWAALALIVWLAFKHRDRLALFLSVFLGSVVVLVVAFEVASDGRFSENLVEVFTPGGSASEGSVLAGISTFLELMVDRAGAIWLLTPFVALALVLTLARRSVTLTQLAFLCALPMVIVVLGNPGSDFNHLLDVGALAILVVAEFWRPEPRASRERTQLLATLVCLAVILGTVQSYRVALKGEVSHAARVAAGRVPNAYTTHPLAGLVDPADSLLSEDPVIPILRGERPVLLDGIGLRRLGERRPSLLADLERRLDAREFDKVVLINEVDNLRWYEEISMGKAIRDAIARNYVLFGDVAAPPHERYWVFAPRRPSDS
jgi:hypothetical protein